jgi:hypothetical protein
MVGSRYYDNLRNLTVARFDIVIVRELCPALWRGN